MKVFMLGWEFPPFISGGLGTACYGLTKAMSAMGMDVLFVLPRPVDTSHATHVRMLTPKPTAGGRELEYAYDELQRVRFLAIESMLSPYTDPQQYQQRMEEVIRTKRTIAQPSAAEVQQRAFGTEHYSGDMFAEVHRYANAAVKLAMEEDFDVVHAHDWMTYPAGIAVAAVTGRPLVVHVHSTEFDRSGEHVNQMIYDIERRGMHAAAKVIAVSHLTRNIILSRYGVMGDKVEVIYNGVERNGDSRLMPRSGISSDEKIVLFLGRITMQKGPEYFLMAAKKVLEEMDNVKFVMAGSGDMMHRTIEMAAEMGIGHKVLFTGFLRGEDVERVYQMADLYVMPSVSEPFGIAPLEALNYDVPVLISKQSGVAEVLTHVLKVDFWDINEMANKIIAVLKYPPLQLTLREHGNFEVRRLRWQDAAEKCARVYSDIMVHV
ncbi:MAG TPA: glycosyltransferase family 4 protein [Anaerohalosphaeraceae bacterium]|jgi:glycogen(starch) synthase|nr:glycosyltransferase family 4 protein [Anaerohalosphaeraceae bacterium]HRT49183.1 glycosyltransferase family 4 protein [Anaerohalosphaeraceae bacterium]HRT85278.1 glycosyltransferase family 4 protein [Anaerohalosphaeraceae bacterium]